MSDFSGKRRLIAHDATRGVMLDSATVVLTRNLALYLVDIATGVVRCDVTANDKGAVGKPSPGLYIAEEIHNNQFRISGGSAGAKVSWQVTGSRHDAFAKAHRVIVEENKSVAERGTLLYPREHQMAAERASTSSSGTGH